MTTLVLYLALQPGRASPVAIRSPSARTTYLGDCAVCHGADGTGTDRGPTLKGVGPASVSYWITSGQMPLPHPGATPRRRASPYTKAQQRRLIRYVLALAGPGGVRIPTIDVHKANLARGATAYQLNCAACHDATGVGGALTTREAPRITNVPAQQVAEAIRIGPGTMPAFGTAAVNDRQLNDLTGYVRYLGHPDNRGGLSLGGIGPLAEGAIAAVVGLGLLVLVVRWIGTRT
jgi:ubiquinol-cytochrome c reductase cytochrome c subunit